jgi:hypothetical protein
MTHENEAAEQPEEEVGVTTVTVTTKCLDIVEQYRTGNIYKGDAIYEFAKAIPVGEDESAESPGKTLESYISMLDDWDRERTLSDADEQHEEVREEEPDGDAISKGHKRAQRNDGDEYDAECDEPIHRRLKIDTEQFPWSVSDRKEGSALRDECVATRNLIANYILDVKLAKSHLLNSGAAPEFPDSEWKSLLSGLAVNLDAVFSGRYSTEHDAKTSHEIGDFTISTREATVSKSVKTAGDWFIAWNQASAATTFAFPHRNRECQDYGRHILDLFAAFAEEHHRLILNYDRAVRKRVALRRNLLLTDLTEFGDLRVQFLDVRGANSGSQAQTNTGRRSARRSGDPCLRWNRGICPSTAERCTYKHVCSYCRIPDHVNSACPNKPKTGADRGQRRQTE